MRKKCLNKEFRWNGVILSVQTWSLLPYQKHLVNKALKFSAAFQDGKLLVKIGRSLIVVILQVFTDDRVLVLLDAQVEVTARVAYIIRITRITLKFIHNALLVYK